MNREHLWTELLSEYVDGGLSSEDRVELEEHLLECAPCGEVLEDLRSIVEQAKALPDTSPERDLWPEVAAAIGALREAKRGQVIALPTAEGDRTRRDARVSLTRAQLAAAAVLLVVMSALATWWAGPGLAVESAAVGASAPGAVVMAADAPGPPEGLAAQLESLELTLAESASALDQNTMRIIEKNLAVIERAIEESRQALTVDPGNAFLVGHLDRAYRRKLSYLREAAQLASWSG